MWNLQRSFTLEICALLILSLYLPPSSFISLLHPQTPSFAHSMFLTSSPGNSTTPSWNCFSVLLWSQLFLFSHSLKPRLRRSKTQENLNSILISTRPLTSDPIYPSMSRSPVEFSNESSTSPSTLHLICNYLRNFWAMKWVIFIKNKGCVWFILNYQNTIFIFPCKKCDTDFLMYFWRQFGQKWLHIRWKSHHFLSKFHDLNLSKIHVMFYHGIQIKPGYMTWILHKVKS